MTSIEDRHRRACRIIWEHWTRGEVIDALPQELQPASRAEGYAIQAGLEQFSSSPRYGWKIAATSAAGQQHIGVDQPLAGRLLVENIVGDGATVSVIGNRMRVVEPEFAFRLRQDIPPRNRPYTVDEAMAATGALHLCLELPDSRFADFAVVGGPALIADSACAGRLVVAQEVAADWRSLDLSQHKVNAAVGGRYTRYGIGSNVLGDPRAALAWLINEVTSLGITLRKGELITTGTCAIPLEIEPDDKVSVDYGTLGTISVVIAA